VGIVNIEHPGAGGRHALGVDHSYLTGVTADGNHIGHVTQLRHT
jgi:hypothetical protein